MTSLSGTATEVPTEATRRSRGVVIEVYRAASLQRWGLTHHKYKGSDNRAEREGLIAALLRAAPWLELGAYADLCARSDDALDAVVAALTARAAALGLTSTPADGHQRDLAQREGWIALPEASLSALVEDADQAGWAARGSNPEPAD